MRALLVAFVLLSGCAGEPRVVDLRPAVEACIAKGMLPGAVKVDADGKLLDALCLEVRLKRAPPGSES